MLEQDEHSQEARQGLDQAQKLLKRSTQEDYYRVLNVRRPAPTGASRPAVRSARRPRRCVARGAQVSRSATSRELKRNYHKLAVEYHPDKNKDKDEKEREAAEERFKLIAHAYEV